MKQKAPSLDLWLSEAKNETNAPKVGMYLFHNGVVRESARAKVRQNVRDARPVVGMDFSYSREELELAIREAYQMEGIYHVRVWLNEGRLEVGDDLMLVLVGGDIRDHVIQALEQLVRRVKTCCVTENELYKNEDD